MAKEIERVTENLVIPNAHIFWLNLRGAGSDYNAEGHRTFTVSIDNPEQAKYLHDIGWGVRVSVGTQKEYNEWTAAGWSVHKVRTNDRGEEINAGVDPTFDLQVEAQYYDRKGNPVSERQRPIIAEYNRVMTPEQPFNAAAGDTVTYYTEDMLYNPSTNQGIDNIQFEYVYLVIRPYDYRFQVQRDQFGKPMRDENNKFIYIRKPGMVRGNGVSAKLQAMYFVAGKSKLYSQIPSNEWTPDEPELEE